MVELELTLLLHRADRTLGVPINPGFGQRTACHSIFRNQIRTQQYLADVLARSSDHPARQIAERLPWHCKPADLDRAAA
jgi:hypothetical protein